MFDKTGAAIFAVVSFATPWLGAQTTIQVGGAGGQPDIAAALAIAQPGDELLVQPGLYPHFLANIGVTIRAATPGTVDVDVDASSLPTPCGPACIQALETRLVPPAGQSLHVQGVNFRGALFQVGGGVSCNRVRINGRVSMRDCSIRSTVLEPLVVESGSEVFLQGCSIVSDYPYSSTAHLWTKIASINGSRFAAVDCEFLMLDDLPLAVAAVDVSNCLFHGSGLRIERPNGTAIFQPLRINNSTVFLTDSQVVASSACAVEVGAGQLLLDRTTLVDGALATGCVTGQVGGARLGVSDAAPPTGGAPYTVTWRTTPNTPVGVFFGPSLQAGGVTGVAQNVWLPLATAQPAALLLADPAGVAIGVFPLPALVGMPRPQLWMQAISGQLPLQVSPPVGGVLR